MYSKELEELIESVLADGVITDQERSVLRNRAQASGEDPDEVMIVVEGRLAKMKKSTNPIKNGNVVKCPNCGAPIKAGALRCEECGYEFHNVNANKTAEKFNEGLQKLQGGNMFTDALSMHNKEAYIENYPIPNSLDDVLELMQLSKQHANRYGAIEEQSYWKLFCRCVYKVKDSGMTNDPRFQPLLDFYNTQSKKKNITGWLIGALLIFIVVGGCAWSVYDSFNSEQKQETNVESNTVKEENDENNIKDKVDKQYDKLSSAIESMPEATADNVKSLRDQLRQLIWAPITTEAETAKKTFKSPSDDEKYERAKKEAFYKLVKVKASTLETVYEDAFNEEDETLSQLAEDGYEK